MRVELFGRVIGARCDRGLGMMSGRIRNSRITASSQWDKNHASYLARLNHKRVGHKMGAWSARRNDRNQWLRVDFGRLMRITKIGTQGRQDASQWVTQYYVSYSQDGIIFTDYKAKSSRWYFPGNRDRNTIKTSRLFPQIVARVIRIHPWGWRSHISMRAEFYGCPQDPGTMPLGVEDKRIPNGGFSASTYYNSALAPWHGRLNHRWSWSARSRNRKQWLQVYFGLQTKVKGVATQGRQDANQWVKSYKLSYSQDGMRFVPYKIGGRVKIFSGNFDRHGIVYHQFPRIIQALDVRIYPITWYSWNSMRVEFYGYPNAPLCNRALGMQSGRIKSTQLSASSVLNNKLLPTYGRLNRGGWCSRRNSRNEWYKVDFRRPTIIRQIGTLAYFKQNWWIRAFRLEYSQDGLHWVFYTQARSVKTFSANWDRYTLKLNPINPPIMAQFIRIRPTSWSGRICLRAEFYGCNADPCDMPLGMEDSRVTKQGVKATSMWNIQYAPWEARLHGNRAWLSRQRNTKQWLQIDLGTTSRLKRIATQGRYNADQWVTSYTLSKSLNGIKFSPYREGRGEMVFQGNSERYFVVTHRFNRPFKARFVRIHPRKWKSYIAMRVELYGCRLGKLCNRALGMQSGKIRSLQVTSSSSWDKFHIAYLARLHRKRVGRYAGAWSAAANNYNQWLQIDFGRATKIVRIATQGRIDADQWVTNYYLTFAQDGLHFAIYKQYNRMKVFKGSTDRNTVVSHGIIPPIRARYLRMHPKSWRSHISMRVEFYGCAVDSCKVPLGLEDGRIPNGNLRASSMYNHKHGPDRGRVNIPSGHGRVGAWCARYNNHKQWLQVDIGGVTRITGCATQGRYDANQWVTSYAITHSVDGRRFTAYRQYGKMRIFQGNFDRYTIVVYRFVPSFKARYVRFHPKTWYSHISMRVEVYGCAYGPICNKALGIQSGGLKNKYLTASSYYDARHAPWLARLHLIRRGRNAGGWVTRHNNHNQWLQITYPRTMKITAILTQGRQDYNQWVKSFWMLFSQDGAHWVYYQQYGQPKTFQANRDRNGVALNSFDPPFEAKSIRVNPRGWYSRIAMRIELFGCTMGRCQGSLGVQDNRIPNQLMTSSTFYNYWCAPYFGRLYQRRYGRFGGAWCAKRSDRKQYLQVDFEALTRIKAVATQGRHNADQWVTKYYVTYSRDGSTFVPYREWGIPKIFDGNYDRNIVVKHRFLKPILARYVRVYPAAWKSWISMRVEFYGCVVGVRCDTPLGLSNGRIRNRDVTASSYWSILEAPWRGRLNTRRFGRRAGGWVARNQNTYQWFQVDFGRPMKVTKVDTQGRSDANQWVTRYHLLHSTDGAHFVYVKSNGNNYMFQANRDRNSIKSYRFFPLLRARFVRIRPMGWYRFIAVRAEFYGCAAALGRQPLGVEDGRIPRGQLRAFTFYNNALAPYLGRLHSFRSWSARINNARQWLQVDLGSVGRITGVATQGRRDANQWVTRYLVSYSRGTVFKAYREKGKRFKLFPGNKDRNTVVYNRLKRPIIAQYVRFHPKAWHGHISMRVELYGYQRDLLRIGNKALGVQSGRIKNKQISASSSWDKFHGPYRGRLNNKRRGRYMGGWSARHNNYNQWIAVDVVRVVQITMVATQGRKIANQWVKRYVLSYSQDSSHYWFYRDRKTSNIKYFTGNRDRSSIVTRSLTPPIIARVVKFHPKGWYRHISMRVELYGFKPAASDIPVGVEDGRLPDVAFSASSRWNAHYAPYQGRLNHIRSGRDFGAWIARYNNRKQWFQIDLGTLGTIYKIGTQGRYDADQWVMRYTLGFSSSGKRFIPYQEERRIRLFAANYDRHTVVINTLRRAIKSRYFRIYPRQWYRHISMRVELYGLTKGHICNRQLGMKNGRIKNHAISASSEWDKYHAARLARLYGRRMGRYMGAWSARYNNHYQWLQIEMLRVSKVIKIATQGRPGVSQWVTSYYLLSSIDGIHYSYYKHNSNTKLFQGNRNSDSVVFYSLIPPMRGRFVRINPRGWYRHISMRLELYGCALALDEIPIGVEDARIPDKSLKASSMYNFNHGPHRSRLNIRNSGGTGAWCARYNNRRQFLQVEFGPLSKITGIATQGRYEANQWVKSYTLGYSRGGVRYIPIRKLFQGNSDRNTIVYNSLNPAVYARSIRVYPVTWYSHISMRVEFYGYNRELLRSCFLPLGMSKGCIRNRQLKASSSWDRNHGPSRARLNIRKQGSRIGAWSSRYNNRNQWLMIDVGKPTRVTKIATQGRDDANQFVRSYYLFYSQNGKKWHGFRERGKMKLFRGNFDRYSIVENPINPAVNARYIRINPRSWHSHISMRVELYGCKADYPEVVRPRIEAIVQHSVRGTSKVLLRCRYTVRARKRRGIVTLVTWKINKRVTRRYQTINRNYALLAENTYGFRAGTTVTCYISVRFRKGRDWSMQQASMPFFAGIKVNPLSLFVSESSSWKPISITTSVPISCHRGRRGCKLKVDIHRHSAIVTDKCHLSLTEGNRKNYALYVKAIKDFRKLGRQKVWVSFKRIRPIAGLSRFWVGYKLKSVQVSTVSRGTKMCRSSGDPHILTFDRKYYDILRNPGDYILVKSIKQYFEIHVRIWPCWRVVCNCGIVIRYKNDVVAIDMCHRGTPRVIQRSRRSLGNRIRITRRGSGKSTSFKAYIETGDYIDFHSNWWGVNLYVYLTGAHKNAINGLCGNYNGRASDDLGGRGVYGFAGKWSLKRGSSYFYRMPRRIKTAAMGGKNRRPACACVRGKKGLYRNTCDVKPPPSVVHKGKGEKPVIPIKVPEKPKKPGRKENKDYDPGAINYKFEPKQVPGTIPKFPLKNGITKRQALANCKRKLRYSRLARACKRLVRTPQKTLHECMTDIRVTGKMKLVLRSAIKNLQEQCKKAAEQKKKPDKNVLNKICPANCNGRGRCIKSKCYCKRGYTALDCSIKKNLPPVVIGLQSKGLCDLRKRACKFSSIYGKAILDSKKLTCHIQKAKYTRQRWLPLGREVKKRGLYESFSEARCRLPLVYRVAGKLGKSRHLPTRFLIALSNNGRLTSKRVTLTIYDSACFRCYKNGYCTRKKNNCVINGYCYKPHERNPRNKQEKCLPQVNRYRWTKVGPQGRPLGMQSGKIPNSALRASSSWDPYHGPGNSRLHAKRRGKRIGAWAARHNNKFQWIQVKFDKPKTVTACATQGRQDTNQWVRRYYLSYSIDGVHFVPYFKRGRREIFRGNRDRNTVVKHQLRPPIRAKYVRINPVLWYRHIALRLEFYGHKVDRSRLPLGVEDGRIQDSRLTSSSRWNDYHSPQRARLNICRKGPFIGAWSAARNNRKQWLQIDIGSRAILTAIATQGRCHLKQWVTRYLVAYSFDGIRFGFYKARRKVKIFPGNKNRNSIVKNHFIPVLNTRYVRVYPVSWFAHISMRVELYGKRKRRLPRVRACGLSSGKIPDRNIKASSSWDKYHGPNRARLNIRRHGANRGGWSARRNNRRQWIQVDLAKAHRVEKIETQGRQDYKQWVTKYTVGYSQAGKRWTPYKKNGRVKVFKANIDQNTISENVLDPTFRARLVRIYPKAWHGHISMRLEIYGYPVRRSSVPVGISSWKLPCSALSASSRWDKYHAACYGRLNNAAKGRKKGGWSARKNDKKQWIQVRLATVNKITRVLTQGRQDANQWVTSYWISYSRNGINFTPYKESGRIRVFPANNDRNSIVWHKLKPFILAKQIRIHPLTFFGHVSMRMELFGRQTAVRPPRPKPKPKPKPVRPTRPLPPIKKPVFQNGLCPVTADIGFALDSSRAVGKWNFMYEKSFVKGIARRFTITQHQSHVGVITFAKHTHLQFKFGEHTSLAAVNLAINRIPFINGKGRSIDRAVQQAYTVLYRSQPTYIPHVLVIITGGRQRGAGVGRLRRLGVQYMKRNVKVFVVSVGKFNGAHLMPLSHKKRHVYHVRNFKDLPGKATAIARAICREQEIEVDLLKRNQIARLPHGNNNTVHDTEKPKE